jgi:NAD(P)-dependent dehydrogenase (short-subunit alcohol dehydrogenase family)
LFLHEGARVLGVGQDGDRLDTVTAELRREAPGRFSPVLANLAAPTTPALIAQAAREAFGAVDLLVNNAGVMLWRDAEITEEPPGILEQTLEVNLLAPHRLVRELLPLLLLGRAPRVINVSSGAGTHFGLTEPGIAAYRVSKWALNGLTMAQARELSGRVSVVALDPGWLKTDLGGPNAPGVPADGARGLLLAALLPFIETGKFYKDGREIDW